MPCGVFTGKSNMLDKLFENPKIRLLTSRLAEHTNCRAEGLIGSSAAHLLSAVIGASERASESPVLVIAPGETDSERMADDLRAFRNAFSSTENIIQFPMWDFLGGDESPLAIDAFAERARALRALKESVEPTVVVCSVQSVMQPTIAPEQLRGERLQISVGEDISLRTFREYLAKAGYSQSPVVELRGEFSVRGGIIDIFPVTEEYPYRIELFGDTVDSIRVFDLATQRSIGVVSKLSLSDTDFSQLVDGTLAKYSILDHLPEDAIIAIHEPQKALERAETYSVQMGEERIPVCPAEKLIRQIRGFTCLHLTENTGDSEGEIAAGFIGFEFDCTTAQRFEGRIEDVIRELAIVLGGEENVCVFCHNDSERDRLRSLLKDAGVGSAKMPEFRIGRLFEGYRLVEEDITVLTDHEIFHRYDSARTVRKRKDAMPISSFLELEPEDYVVHETYGIGLYHGLEKLEIRGQKEDFLTILFADGARVHVPVSCIYLVQKYVGGGEARPELSKLGTNLWAKKKESVREALEHIAAEMLDIQAARLLQKGIAYPMDDEEQRKFEASFIYEETPDQLDAALEIKEDMQRDIPMDRLLCGDVGFGKTEVALRSAFKAISAGYQVAVLVPTTILAQQHFETFTERFADYPVIVACLNRFRTRGEQNKIVERLKEGSVDIVIGTHRLLQKDIGFRKLGMVIVDEEQRFGVRHKERLKQLRQELDILTLTATPIPRTLHMALLGIKDISALETPPEDRLAIMTKVMKFDPAMIRRAILRELERDGQVYFVHNRVQDIRIVLQRLQSIVPEARFGVAHGQMPKRKLQEVMKKFVHREMDVLVATTIIESGIDIPNVNTIFIDEADRYGLSDLHQLRGRIGRYKYRAFAYLLLPYDRDINARAKKRLRALEEYSELGAGFKLAMKDLEIRGAGNILGLEQHGNIVAVGYDLYCRLLDKAVRRQRGEPEKKMEILQSQDVFIRTGRDASISAEYVPQEELRIGLYRRLAAVMSEKEITDLRDEVTDRFGRPPEAFTRLLEVARLRFQARLAGVCSLELEPGGRRVVKLKFIRPRLRQIEAKLNGFCADIVLLGEREAEISVPNGKNAFEFAKKLLTLLVG